MNTLEITYRKKKRVISLPEKWNELSPRQLMWIADMWDEVRVASEIYPAGMDYYRAKALMYLAGYSHPKIQQFFSARCRAILRLFPSKNEVRFEKDSDELIERYEHIFHVMALTDFLFLRHVELTENKFPTISTRNRQFPVLYGPGNEYCGIVFKEFVFIDTLFCQWSQNKSDRLLDDIVSIMYRPKGNISITDKNYTGDNRAPFNSTAVDQWLPAVKQLPKWFKWACVLFYSGCRKKWEADYPHVFSHSEDSGDTHEGWFGIMSELPAQKFGTFNEREYTSADAILMELNRVIQKSKQNNVTNS